MNIKNIRSAKKFRETHDFKETYDIDPKSGRKEYYMTTSEKKVMPVTVAGFSIVPKKQYDIMVISHKEPEGAVDDDSGITFGKWQRYDGKDAIKVLQHVEFGLNKGMLEVAVDEVK